MSARIIGRSVWNNPGNRHKRLRKLVGAFGWQIYKRTIRRPRTITLANHVKFRAYPDCVISSALQYADWPEFHELQFCRRHLQPGDAVLDVGANVGHFALLMADIVGPQNLHCYEPTPVTWKRLRENFELNGWPLSNLHAKAMARQEGWIEFPDSASPDTTNSALWSKTGVPMIKVQTISLDSIIPVFACKPAGMLKIDVEGFETEVFLGAKLFLKQVRPHLIMFESLSQRLDAAIAGVFAESAYVAFQLDDKGWPVKSPLDGQNLFASPEERFAALSQK